MANNLQAVNIFPPPFSSDDETEDEDGSSTITTVDEQQHHPPQPQQPQDYWSLYPRLCAALEEIPSSEIVESNEVFGYVSLWPGGTKEHVKKIISGMRKGKARKLEDALEGLSVMRQQVDAMTTSLLNEQAEIVSGIMKDAEESGIKNQVNEGLVDDDAGIVET